MGAAEAASGQMTTGILAQISVKTKKEPLYFSNSIKAILTLFTDPEAQRGRIFYEMETLAAQVGEILS